MVAVDENRNPVPVPPLDLVTKEQKQRFQAAEQRRERRKAVTS
jgi:acyl-CoA hydrolase